MECARQPATLHSFFVMGLQPHQNLACVQLHPSLSSHMTMTLDIPDELSGALAAKFGNLGRAALEALAAVAYAKEALSLEQVRRLLALDSRWEAQQVLVQHEVWPGQTLEDVLEDLGELSKLPSA